MLQQLEPTWDQFCYLYLDHHKERGTWIYICVYIFSSCLLPAIGVDKMQYLDWSCCCCCCLWIDHRCIEPTFSCPGTRVIKPMKLTGIFWLMITAAAAAATTVHVQFPSNLVYSLDSLQVLLKGLNYLASFVQIMGCSRCRWMNSKLHLLLQLVIFGYFSRVFFYFFYFLGGKILKLGSIQISVNWVCDPPTKVYTKNCTNCCISTSSSCYKLSNLPA